MKYYVFALWGSTRAGDRNGSCWEFDTIEEATAHVATLPTERKDCQVWMVHGTGVDNCFDKRTAPIPRPISNSF